METVLPGAQHREAGTSRVRAVGKEGGISPPDGRRHQRQQDAAVDQFRCMNEKAKWRRENLRHFLLKIGLEKGFSTAST
ncbi:hypothetical protein [Quatrionicoccus australiensis]|uniref:hypothetical protein n=1 Tax=Quatrionicoccus australiensis TaxID=138118 RepID=UPI001CFA4207|nr:hypothetical protein [Quatrionicoccus australiensis]MCB4358880.1 hypothetical protein [Quatrionicoccus australiensis]